MDQELHDSWHQITALRSELVQSTPDRSKLRSRIQQVASQVSEQWTVAVAVCNNGTGIVAVCKQCGWGVQCAVEWCGVVWCADQCGRGVWCGVVWYGVVWCGAVRCGVGWCGVVCSGVVELWCVVC